MVMILMQCRVSDDDDDADAVQCKRVSDDDDDVDAVQCM